MSNFKTELRSVWLCRPSSLDTSSLTLSPRYPKGSEAMSTLRQQVDKEGVVVFCDFERWNEGVVLWSFIGRHGLVNGERKVETHHRGW